MARPTNLIERISKQVTPDKTATYNVVTRKVHPFRRPDQPYGPIAQVLGLLGFTKGDVFDNHYEIVKISGKNYTVPGAVGYHIRSLKTQLNTNNGNRSDG